MTGVIYGNPINWILVASCILRVSPTKTSDNVQTVKC